MKNVIDFQAAAQVQEQEERKKIGKELYDSLMEETPLTDTSDWSREKLERVYKNLCLFIGAYDHLYDLYEYVRHDAESLGFSNTIDQEFYDHVIDEVEGDEMLEIYEEEYGKKFNNKTTQED